jgi:hypothetical protein
LGTINPLVENLASEGFIPMESVAAIYASGHGGRPPHKSTPTRHALKGVRGPDGNIVKLESCKVGGRLVTSRAAVLRFLSALNAAPEHTDRHKPATPASSNRRASKASAELDAILGTNS